MKTFAKCLMTSVAAFALFMIASVASAATSVLTQVEKEALHRQYVEVVQQVKAEYDGVMLEVAPIEMFAEEDWIAPEDFKELAIDRANMTFEMAPQDPSVSSPFSTAYASKDGDIKSSSITRTITASGSFETAYNATAGRQVFFGINSLTSSLKSGTGTWKQTGYTPRRIDGGRTYAIDLSGTFTLNGLVSGHHIYYEFYCSAEGRVS